MFRRAVVTLAVALVTLAAGCATVSPWEREDLARTDMQFEGNRDRSAGEEHATEVREGTSGGLGGGGGGCGCN
jgi:hypothetical protein